MSTNLDEVVTIQHAAKALSLTEAALYLAIKENRVNSLVMLGRIVLPRHEFDRLKKEKTKKKKNGSAK